MDDSPFSSTRPPTTGNAAEAERWQAVRERRADADGSFIYAVTTTGVYCRPSCPSRHARREHVRFFADPAEARAAGFRACRRCAPDGPSAQQRQVERVAAACRMIDAAETPPSLDVLAAAAGVSRFHFQRMFKAIAGVTPAQYARGRRAERLRQRIATADSVTRAVYDAGFNASSRFYEAADRTLGMAAADYRNGGAGMRIRFAIGQCSLGAVLVAASERGVCAILLDDRPEPLLQALQQAFPRAELLGGDAAFEQTVARVVGMIEQPAGDAALPLDLRGTAFQIAVWNALTRIPPGRTATYAEIAAAIGRPTAVRAVARACASNRLAVAIPCHRVVRTDGGLSGYRWGIERKAALLEREA